MRKGCLLQQYCSYGPAKLAQEFTQPHFYTPPAKKSLARRSEATRQIASKSRVRYVAAPWLQEQFWT